MKITVVGAGVMGPGIAQVFMLGGHKVLLHDVAQEMLDKGVKRVAGSLNTMNEAGVLKQSPAEYMSLLTTTTSKTEAYDGAKLVIEAIPEKLNLKEKLYHEMDPILPPDAIISSNTSSLPLPNIFPDFRPGRFIVSHFFNPPPLIPLVELVGNKHTDPECLKWLKELLIQCGKSPIVLKDFVKGFFANRVQGAAGRETMYLVNKGIISLEDAESVNMSFMGIKCSVQGQFTQYDHIGLDTVALVHSVVTPDLCTSPEVSPLIKEKLDAGKLGIKTGEGFFKYEGDKAAEAVKKREVMMLEQLKFYNKYWKKAD